MILLYFFVAIATFLITLIIERRLIPILSKNAKQPIYEGGPSWHANKKGTPTMGGLAFIISVLFIGLIAAAYITSRDANAAVSLLLVLGYALANALVGVLDDLTKLKRKENAGLTPKQKLALQLLISVLFITARAVFFKDTTALHFSFGTLNLGILYFPFSLVILLGITNCANLTDGVDGLAGSVAFAISSVILIVSLMAYEDAALLSSALIGATLGFLIFNVHPAKVFMGDTGSLFLGSAIAAMGFSLGNPALLIPVCAVYVIEGISVILQVVFFKLTGKRLFKMAPIHHHLEKCGMSENKICVLAMIFTFLSSLILVLLYPS